MTLHRTLKIISALMLLICAAGILLNLATLALDGVSSDFLFLSYIGVLTLAFAVTLVASYRQVFKPFPKLIITAFCLVLVSQILGYLLLQHLSNDPIHAQMIAVMEDAIRQGLADGTILKGQGFEEQLANNSFELTDLFKSLGFYITLFILPLYLNLRKNTATIKKI